MTRTRYGLAPWLDGAPRKGHYPALTEQVDTPVVIIGAGLAGAATAYACAAAGIRAVLLEAALVGHGSTGNGTGLILQSPPAALVDLEALHGRRTAKLFFSGTRRAALELAATVRRLKLRCGFSPADLVTWAATADAARALERELAARREAGFEATGVTSRGLAALGLRGDGGLRTRGDALVDPARLCQGFARAAAARGCRVFERAKVTRVAVSGGRVRVETPRGAVDADTVIVATGAPSELFDPLARHVAPCERYVVQTPPLPAAVRGAIRDHGVVLQDCEQPPHRLAWAGDRIVWSGADQPRTPERGRDKTLVQRTGQLMYELSLVLPAISGIQPQYGWDAPYSTGRDGLPLVGPHRNYPHHLFAFGLGTNPAAAFMASRTLLRHVSGAVEKGDEALGFARLSSR